MGLTEYFSGIKLESAAHQLRWDLGSNPFYSLIQAAMRVADTDNLEKLQSNFPEVWDELQKRYNLPAGLLPEEKEIYDMETIENMATHEIHC